MTSTTLHARWVAICALLFVSLGGVMLPFYVVRYWDESVMQGKPFRLTRAFATGLVCGVAVLHVLADADEYLQRVTAFPMAHACMLVGAFVMVVVKEFGAMGMEVLSAGPQGYEQLLDVEAPQQREKVGRKLAHTHSHPLLELRDQARQGSGRKIVVFAMEASIALHAVLIGLGLGVITHHQAKVVTLAVALLFHQFFEGVALGMAAVKAQLTLQAAAHLVATFSISCPLGAAVGVFASSVYDDKAPQTDWVLGILNGLAAGMLVHIGFCELLAEDFGEHADDPVGCHDHAHSAQSVTTRLSFKTAKLLALFAGGAVMTILAEWA